MMCVGVGVRKMHRASDEIAAPFRLAMTIIGESKCKLFHAPLNNRLLSSKISLTEQKLKSFNNFRNLSSVLLRFK